MESAQSPSPRLNSNLHHPSILVHRFYFITGIKLKKKAFHLTTFCISIANGCTIRTIVYSLANGKYDLMDYAEKAKRKALAYSLTALNCVHSRV